MPNGRKFLFRAVFLAKRPADHAPALVQIDPEFLHSSVRILCRVDKCTTAFHRGAIESLDIIGALTRPNRPNLRVAQRVRAGPSGRASGRRDDKGSQDKGGHE